jgi:type I restriction enzyme S subunit
MSFPRYPEYKPSGVEWLGDVPEHWEVRRLKRFATATPSNVDKKSHDGEQPVHLCNYVDVYYNDEITSSLDFMTATASDDQISKFTLRRGDTIITKDSETADDIAIAAHVPKDLPGVVCGYHLSVIRPQPGTVGKFVKWLFGSRFAKSCFAVRANGLTRVGIGQHDLENVEFPYPPTAEQRSIAEFLDRETAKIDALIAGQERLIELLQEKRQAVISHAVTKGLDPSAPMKPSGVEWLGEVPAHWSVGKCGRFVELLAGFSFPSNEFSDEPSAPRLLRGVNIAPNRIRWDEVVRWQRMPGDGLDRFELREGDLVVGMDRPIVSEGVRVARVCAQDLPALLLQRVTRLRGGGLLELDYLERLLSSDAFAAHFAPETTGVSVPHISPEQIRAFVIPLPPLSEQRSIVAFLRHETGRIDRLIDEAKTAIPLLHERRSALISAAVIGQIDVRNVVVLEAV